MRYTGDCKKMASQCRDPNAKKSTHKALGREQLEVQFVVKKLSSRKPIVWRNTFTETLHLAGILMCSGLPHPVCIHLRARTALLSRTTNLRPLMTSSIAHFRPFHRRASATKMLDEPYCQLICQLTIPADCCAGQSNDCQSLEQSPGNSAGHTFIQQTIKSSSVEQTLLNCFLTCF